MTKTAICYFSGSGNSFDVTLELCKYLDVESIFYLPNLGRRKLDEFDDIIIVSPVYQFNIPKPVQDFIRSLNAGKRYYVVLNGGGIYGKSISTVKKLFKEIKVPLARVKFVMMPSSFSIAIVQPKKMADNILKKSKKKIAKIAGIIRDHEDKNVKMERVGKMKKYVGYTTFSSDLSVNTEKCVSCHKCIAMCPTQNISIYQGKIEFGDKCTSCMGCYNRCEAIEFKGKKGKVYTNPNIDFRLMK